MIEHTLKWMYEMGADEAIDDIAVSRYKKPTLVKSNKPKEQPDISRPVIKSPSALVQKTRKLADECENLEQLKEAVSNFKDLSICKTATNVVFSDGNASSEIMMIGEAPGAEEDLQGRPFCGASGQMLDQMFSYIGLDRKTNFYITNTLFWRPPGNRKPTAEELVICKPFVEKHIALIKPKVIILVGGTAIASILDSKEAITKIRGKYFDYSNQYTNSPIKTTAVFHPSYLLRSPGQKKHAWLDCLNIKKYLLENDIKMSCQ